MATMAVVINGTSVAVLVFLKTAGRPQVRWNESELTPCNQTVSEERTMSGEHVEKCKGCGELIDPDICWCGQSIKHGYDNHPIIPMGCNCCRNAPDEDYASTPHPSAHYRIDDDNPFDGVEPGLGRID